MTGAAAVLPVADLHRSLAWYTRLGFSVRAEYDAYAIVAFDGAEVHLAAHPDLPGDYFSWSGAYLRLDTVDAVDALHRRWEPLGARIIAGPVDAPHGMREFATEDPDHNLWRIGAPLVPATTATTPAPAPDPGDAAPATSDPMAPPTDGAPGTGDDAWFTIVTTGRCADCGLTAGDGATDGLGGRLVDEAGRLGRLVVQADDDAVRRRPTPTTWSALEYAVHVRDTLGVFTDRIARILAEPAPDLGWWDHEAAIEDGMANELEVASVADDLDRNAGHLRSVLAQVTGAAWDRTGTRRSGETFTVETTARFALHEVVHHRGDAHRSLTGA